MSSAAPPLPSKSDGWSIFRNSAFTVIWMASIVSALGTAVFDTASGMMITSLNVSAATVSLVQVAISLPLFLFTVPAGALADVIDSRRLLLVVQIAATVISAVFATFALFGKGTTVTLLSATFFLGIAGALGSPAWSAIVPQLVPRADIGTATVLNSAGYSLARAIGPALGSALIAIAGLNAAFLLFVVSNLGVVGALLSWRKTNEDAHGMPAERIISAIRNGVRFAFNSRDLDVGLVRAVAYFPWACAYLALLPLVAKTQVEGGPQAYGLLLGANSVGAIAGSFVLSPLKAKLGLDRSIVAASGATAVALALLGFTHSLAVAIAACLLIGAAWTVILSILYVSAQYALPDWVRARGLAVLLTMIFGATTVGSLIWGQIASSQGLGLAFYTASIAVLLATPLGNRWSVISIEGADMSLATGWPMLANLSKVENDRGPVLVSLEFRVDADERAHFRDAARELKHARGRDGGYAWSLFEDPEVDGRFVEQFHMESWLELMHLRQRVTHSDRVLLDRIYSLSLSEPSVALLIATKHSSSVVKSIDGESGA